MYKIGQASVLLYACMISFFSAHIYTRSSTQSRLFPFLSFILFSVTLFGDILLLFFSSSSPYLCSHLQSDSDSTL